RTTLGTLDQHDDPPAYRRHFLPIGVQQIQPGAKPRMPSRSGHLCARCRVFGIRRMRVSVQDLTFRPNDDVARMTDAYALDAIDFARDHFGVELSYDRKGIEHLEAILGTFHAQIAQAPSEEHVFQFAKM